MTLKGNSEPENPDVDAVTYLVSVSGSVDSTNNFTGSKTISMRYQNDFADGGSTPFNHVEADIT